MTAGSPATAPPPPAGRLAIGGPAGAIEALLELPEAAGPDVRAVAVICHPHPLHGGTLDNKVVWALARAFRECGAATLRFNFRGVGASAGSYDEARGETDDALAVAAWGRQSFPGRPLWLAGFSFGGVVALKAAGPARPDRLVAVAPAVTRPELGAPGAPACPWLIVQGEADDVVPAPAVLAWSAHLAPAPRVALLPGAGHFFHGRINELRDVVRAFLGTGAAAAPAGGPP